MLVLEGYEALGTKFWIEIYDLDHQNNLKESLIKIIKDFELAYTRFDENSLLNRYNRGEDVYDADLMEMIKLGELYNKESNGVFNIHIKDKLEKIGSGVNSLATA